MTYKQETTSNYFSLITATISSSYHKMMWDGVSRFFSCGVSDVIYSSDGITWTKVNINYTMDDIAYNGSLYVSVGLRYGYKSTNGTSWTQISTYMVIILIQGVCVTMKTIGWLLLNMYITLLIMGLIGHLYLLDQMVFAHVHITHQ